MSEIVPPKLNKETGLFSLIFSRHNLIIAVGLVSSLVVWSTSVLNTVDVKITATLIVGFLLIPFLFDISGRPLHIYIFDMVTYYLSKKNKKIALSKDISEGILVGTKNQYIKVYRIEPINLSMSSFEEIQSFKNQIREALFGLKTEIQILTLQKYSTYDENLDVEITRYNNLSGELQKCCKQYLEEYQELSKTIERYFFLAINRTAKNLVEGKNKLIEEETTLLPMLEKTGIKFFPLNSEEILDITKHLLIA